MICQRCGRECTDDVNRVVRIAGLYSYQDDRYELCDRCLKKIKAFLDDPEIIVAKRHKEPIGYAGAVTGHRTVIEEVLV